MLFIPVKGVGIVCILTVAVLKRMDGSFNKVCECEVMCVW